MGFSQAPGLPYSKLGIPEDGDTASRAISKGKYVIWKGKNYFAKTDILQGETFVEDTNLTEIPDGALNGIADALNASFTYEKVLWTGEAWQQGTTINFTDAIDKYLFVAFIHSRSNEVNTHRNSIVFPHSEIMNAINNNLGISLPGYAQRFVAFNINSNKTSLTIFHNEDAEELLSVIGIGLLKHLTQ